MGVTLDAESGVIQDVLKYQDAAGLSANCLNRLVGEMARNTPVKLSS